MDKLEAIKNKLREMDKECELVKECIECSFRCECYGKIPYCSPMVCLEIIEKSEELLND